MVPLVYIVVVNWNLKCATLDCLDSLMHLEYPNIKILVIDNGSHDGSPEKIAAKFPQIEQIRNQENIGSTAAYNQGFRHALNNGAAYVLLINNDTYIDPVTLNHLVDAMQFEGVALTGPLIYYADEPEKIWSAGANRNPLTLELMGNHGRNQSFTRNTERDFLTSCALLCSRQVLNDIGLMDEDYFVYQEENDYCLRVKQAGYKIILVPHAKVWHRVSLSSGGQESPAERYWMAKNTMIFFRKHVRWWNLFFVIPWRIGSLLKNTIRFLFHRKLITLKMYWKGLLDGLSVLIQGKGNPKKQTQS